MNANLYVDGFNLYYRALYRTRYKWLNPLALCNHVLPKYSINRIRYFTAHVTSPRNDPQKSQRQNTYIRALETLPNLSVHLGHFATHNVLMHLAQPQGNCPDPVEVVKTSEKGSDVNLATYLLVDAFDEEYEAAVIISNDSDLVLPVTLVQAKMGVDVVILNPERRYPSTRLRKASRLHRVVRKSALAACQFQTTLKDARGSFSKPEAW